MKKERIFLFLIILTTILILFINLPFIYSETDIFQNGVSIVNDTYIDQNPIHTGTALNPFLWTGNGSTGNELRTLIKFDISSITSTDTVLDTKLQLYVTDSYGSNNNRIIKVYALTGDWSESEANWFNNSLDNPWTNFGGDYDPNELNYTVLSNQSGIYYNFSIPRDLVQGWINGSYNNYGLILMSNNTKKGNWTSFSSSEDDIIANRPKLIIEHSANYPPTMISMTTNGNDSSHPINTGNNVSFTVNWTDLEINPSKLFVCNSSNINYTGCQGKTFCSSPGEHLGPSSCNYTVLSTDNTTTNFYYAVCDDGSLNCSIINSSRFYVNHAPRVIIIHPNSTETVNESQGNYKIKFNVSDVDNDNIYATIYLNDPSQLNYISSPHLNLLDYCTSPGGKRSTLNNCTYVWDSSGLWGDNFYITINVSDVYDFSSVNYSSNFSIKSITDTTPPDMTEPWTEEDTSDLHSGQLVNFYVNSTDTSIPITAWVEINTIPTTNITMINISSQPIGGGFTKETFEANWTAIEIGNYSYKIHIEDIIPNSNESGWYNLTIRKPGAIPQNEIYPSLTLPYHLIMVTGELDSGDNLDQINATLNVPAEFNFLNGYPRSLYLGDFDYNEIKQAMWILSTPHDLKNYSLNITYKDKFGNSWQGNNFNITVTNSIGNGGINPNQTYTLSITGYPYVIKGENYSVAAFFTQGGNLIQPDSMNITIIQPNNMPIINYPKPMNNVVTGIFNYTTPTDLSWSEGQWETIINATLNGQSYLEYQFWRLLGTVFDVNFLGAIDPHNNNLTLSVSLENKGQQSGIDGKIIWNVTSPTGDVLAWKSQDVNVNAGEIKYYNVTFDASNSINLTDYTGQAKVTVTYLYPSPTYGQIAGSSGIINIIAPGAPYCGDNSCNNGETCNTCQQDCGVCTSPPNGGGGSSGGGGGSSNQNNNLEKADLDIIVENITYLTQNIEKTVILKVNNTGKTELKNIILNLENINQTLFNISQTKINSIKPGNIGEFKINFLVNSPENEIDFNYTVKTDSITKKHMGKIIMVNMSDYFSIELTKLGERIKIINSLVSADFSDDLKRCENITEDLKSDIANQEYLDANEKLKMANDCLDTLENKIKGKPLIFEKINLGSMITWALIIILAILLVISTAYIYKRLRIRNLLREHEKKSKEIIPKTVKEQYFEDKLKDIEDKLNS